MHSHINLAKSYLMLDAYRNPFPGTMVKYVKFYFVYFCIAYFWIKFDEKCNNL